MNRRQFIQGVGYGVLTLSAAGCGVSLPGSSGTVPAKPAASAVASPYDKSKLIVAAGKEPELLIEKGFQALGGIEKLVAKGATVVIKPNFSVPRKPEEAATTNPLLVAAVVKKCLAVGAKEVKVLDYPFNSPPVCLANSGIKTAVDAVGGKTFTTHTQSFYSQVNMGGTILKDVLFSKDVLEADVFINFPILKHHGITKVTLGMKNMMGLVWDRGYFHKTDLNQAIAELAAYRKPQLTIMDATRGIIDHGPVGPGTIQEWNQVVFGVDAVAVDAYGAKLFGVEPSEIAYIAAAAKMGVGEMDLQKISLVKV